MGVYGLVWTQLGHRDSRFSRLGTETPRLSVQEPSRTQKRNRILKDLRTRFGLGIKLFILYEPESDSESNFLLFWNRNRYRNRILRGVVPESEPESKF